jgi:NAD+ kinase
MRIAIFYNTKTNPENKCHALHIAEILTRHDVKYIINPKTNELRAVDIAFSAGGDGTVLYTANLLAEFSIPLLGINFGHRGYLCSLQSENIESALPPLIEGRYQLVQKTRIQANIKKRGQKSSTFDALNEIAIGGINRTVSLDAEIITPDSRIDTTITGDGLIIATQTGSTAYNINAGGAMLLTDVFSIVANNAIFESDFLLPITKSIVIATDSIIKIKNKNNNPANLPFVISDGINEKVLHSGDTLTISRSKYINHFIVL